MGAVREQEVVWGDMSPQRADAYLAAAVRNETRRISSRQRGRRRSLFAGAVRLRRITMNGIGDWDQVAQRLLAAGFDCADAQPFDVLGRDDIWAQITAGAASAESGEARPAPKPRGVKVGKAGVDAWRNALFGAVWRVTAVRARSAMIVAQHLAERFVLEDGTLAAAAVVAVRDVPGVSPPTVSRVLNEFVRLDVLRPIVDPGERLGEFNTPARCFAATVPVALPADLDCDRPDADMVVALGAGLAEAWSAVPRDGTPFTPRQLGLAPRTVRRLYEAGLVQKVLDEAGQPVWGHYVVSTQADDVVERRRVGHEWSTDMRAARYEVERELFAHRIAYLRGETDAVRAEYLAERTKAAEAWRDAALELAGYGFRIIPVWGVLNSGKCGCDLSKDRAESARIRRADQRALRLGIPMESGDPGFRWPSDRPSQCAHIGKHPMFSHWTEHATQDPDRIARLAARFPYANIGVVADDLVVLDIDGYRNGQRCELNLDRVVAELAKRGLALDNTCPAVRTGSGGLSLWHAKEPGATGIMNREDTSFAFIDDDGFQTIVRIDVRTDSGNVVVPPSTHHTGETYEWIRRPDSHRLPLFGTEHAEKLRSTRDGVDYDLGPAKATRKRRYRS